MAAKDKDEVGEIWRAIKTILEGIDELSDSVNKIEVYNILRSEIEQMVEEKVREQFRELGFTVTSKSDVKANSTPVV